MEHEIKGDVESGGGGGEEKYGRTSVKASMPRVSGIMGQNQLPDLNTLSWD